MATETKAPKLRLLLADDHAVLRNGMRHLIEAEPDMEVVGEAEDGAGALAAVERLRPDIVVMDLSMPQMSGAEALRRLRAADASARVLVLTVHEDQSYLREVLEAGALGYMLKRAAPDDLIQAIRAIASGTVYIDPRLSGKLISALIDKNPDSGLGISVTSREEQVLRAIAEGYSMKEIAATLELSVKTVETYKARAMEKLGLRGRVDIVRTAREQGWLSKPTAG